MSVMNLLIMLHGLAMCYVATLPDHPQDVDALLGSLLGTAISALQPMAMHDLPAVVKSRTALRAELVRGVPPQLAQAVLSSGVLAPDPVNPEAVATAFMTAPQQVKVTTVSLTPSSGKRPPKSKKVHSTAATHAPAQDQAKEASALPSTGALGNQPIWLGAGSKGYRIPQKSVSASTKRGKRQ